MTIINGKVYEGNVTIINGQVIGDESCHNSSSKQFDETKKESANGIKQIIINSDIAAVKVSACNTNDITAHLHGSAIMDGNLTLSLTRFNDEIRISVVSDRTSICNKVSVITGNSVVINNFGSCNSDGLTVDISIPNKVIEKLHIQSDNSNINVASSVNVNKIDINDKNGNIDIAASFKSLKIDCKNGNIDVDSEANCDVILYVCSSNGNVDVSIGNIGISDVSVGSKNGNSKNSPKLKGTYIATGYITSNNGNTKFR